jgi:PAS domain-containing protein
VNDCPADSLPAALYRAALDALSEPVLIYDDKQVLYANPAACCALGGSESSNLVGVHLEDFIFADFADVNSARRTYVIEQGVELRNLLLKVRSLGGEPTVMQVDIQPIHFDGSAAAMATLSRD